MHRCCDYDRHSKQRKTGQMIGRKKEERRWPRIMNRRRSIFTDTANDRNGNVKRRKPKRNERMKINTFCIMKHAAIKTKVARIIKMEKGRREICNIYMKRRNKLHTTKINMIFSTNWAANGIRNSKFTKLNDEITMKKARSDTKEWWDGGEWVHRVSFSLPV